jgi:hypothetical protein
MLDDDLHLRISTTIEPRDAIEPACLGVDEHRSAILKDSRFVRPIGFWQLCGLCADGGRLRLIRFGGNVMKSSALRLQLSSTRATPFTAASWWADRVIAEWSRRDRLRAASPDTGAPPSR